MAPRRIHVIFFPWDARHRLKPDEEDFDHAPVDRLREYAPDFEVSLWTYSRARDFALAHYPEVWATVEKCPHPTMMVDILRWLVVWHFGGIYWQISTTPRVSMEALLPTPGKQVRLYTEFVLSPEQCRAMAAEPIRQGEPEEPVRILNQVFAAEPRARFIRRVLDLVLERNRTLTPRNDYDILFIGANAALSTAYDRYGKNDETVERMDREESRCRLHWRYRGSWRKAESAASGVVEPPPLSRAWSERFPGAADVWYRGFRKHPHEQCLEDWDVRRPRTSCLPVLAPVLDQWRIRSVLEVPCGAFRGVPAGMVYIGGDPSRTQVRRNRQVPVPSGVRFVHLHPLFSRLPPSDLILCPDYLEWLPFREVFRVLGRILASRPRWLALTGCRLLDENWDTPLGDHRPLNSRLPPFGFPEPAACLALPPVPDRRPDRCLFVWERAALPALADGRGA